MARRKSARRVTPSAANGDDYLTRIQLALDMSTVQLANALDMSPEELVDRHGSRAVMSDYFSDPFWPALSKYVDERIGGLIAVREELQRKARMDARKRHEQRTRVLER